MFFFGYSMRICTRSNLYIRLSPIYVQCGKQYHIAFYELQCEKSVCSNDVLHRKCQRQLVSNRFPRKSERQIFRIPWRSSPRCAPSLEPTQKLNESFLSFITEDYRSTCKMDRGRVTLSSLRIHARKPILSTLRLLCLMSRLLLWE